MTAPTDVIGVARRYLGVKESPPNSNRQQFGAWCGLNGTFWCAEFASFCLYTAGYRWTDATYKWGFAYCPDIVAWGKKHGRISRTPHVGDLAVAINDKGVAHHVELVSVAAGTNFTSIGGNTGPANLSNGGEVLEHIHPVAGWVFISPLYDTPAAHPAPAPGGKPSPVKRNIAVTSPFTTGKDVLWAQEKLAGLHYPISKADGVYGPQTAAAVRAFQAKVGLVADGILGPVTGDHLVAGK